MLAGTTAVVSARRLQNDTAASDRLGQALNAHRYNQKGPNAGQSHYLEMPCGASPSLEAPNVNTTIGIPSALRELSSILGGHGPVYN